MTPPADILSAGTAVEAYKPDLSESALADQWTEDSTQQTDPDEGIVAGDEDPEDLADVDEDVEDEDSEESDEGADDGPVRDDKGRFAPKDKPAEPVSDDPNLPEHLKGKTVAELAKMFVNAEQMAGKQTGELGELRKLVEAQSQQLEQITQQQRAIAADGYSDELASHAPIDPMTAYARGLELLNDGKIPVGAVEQIIDAAHEIDPVAARRMERDFAMRLARAESLQSVQQVMQQQQPAQQYAYEGMVREATQALWDHEQLGPDAKAYAADIEVALRGQHLGNSPREIATRLHSALVAARGADPTKSVAYRQALEQSKANAQVEAGGSEPEQRLTEEDLIRQKIFGRSEPADLLFAPMEQLRKLR